eukprot:2821427-Prymnesium_polylepis.1
MHSLVCIILQHSASNSLAVHTRRPCAPRKRRTMVKRAPFARTTYEVPVPEGGCEGDVLSIELPSGDVATVTVPAGIAPGELLEFVWPPGATTPTRDSLLMEIEVPPDTKPGDISAGYHSETRGRPEGLPSRCPKALSRAHARFTHRHVRCV